MGRWDTGPARPPVRSGRFCSVSGQPRVTPTAVVLPLRVSASGPGSARTGLTPPLAALCPPGAASAARLPFGGKGWGRQGTARGFPKVLHGVPGPQSRTQRGDSFLPSPFWKLLREGTSKRTPQPPLWTRGSGSMPRIHRREGDLSSSRPQLPHAARGWSGALRGAGWDCRPLSGTFWCVGLRLKASHASSRPTEQEVWWFSPMQRGGSRLGRGEPKATAPIQARVPLPLTPGPQPRPLHKTDHGRC